jgi:hypothetical protein
MLEAGALCDAQHVSMLIRIVDLKSSRDIVDRLPVQTK